LVLALVVLNVACGAETNSPFAENLSSRDWTVNDLSPTERTYCTTSFTYSSETITVSGQAGFQYRDTILTPGEEGLGDVADSARAIRHAQYEVVNAAGQILQCGETDENGSFSFVVPLQERTLTLKIFSRSNNLFNRVSVFKAPETNELYSLDYSFFASEDKLNVSISAEAKNTVLGGAFFILDQIHIVFDRLKVLLATPLPGSRDIDAIPKAEIYWEAGFDPSLYTAGTPGSFLSPEQNKIFILGGDNGNVNFNDTDHFDPSVIMHEYFHFLENSVGSNSSPGGSHNGNEVLDPRLAWSEGAAQFFQAAILNRPSVIDTRGNTDGVTGLLVKYGLENDINDRPSITGEGDYREFAVARFLWDLFDDESAPGGGAEDAPEDSFDKLSDHFPEFWQVLTNTGLAVGTNSDDAAFISMGLILEAMEANGVIPANDELSDVDAFDTTWKLLLNNERLTYDELDSNNSFRGSYGIATNYLNTTTDTFILPAPFSAPASELVFTNPIRNINFHTIIIGGDPDDSSNNRVLSLTRTNGNGTLEFYVFKEGYAGLDKPSSSGDEGVSVTLPPGTYLVAVVIKSITSNQNNFEYNFNGFGLGGF